jgi:hypothetical protein
MNTKIRTIVITLMAACSFAGVLAPGASAAQKQGSGYDCSAGKTWFDTRVGDYEKLKGSNAPAAGDAKKDAENEKNRAKEAGCDVSNWKVPARILLGQRAALLKKITVAPQVTAPSSSVEAAKSVTFG